jgi:hypothetical protein
VFISISLWTINLYIFYGFNDSTSPSFVDSHKHTADNSGAMFNAPLEKIQ